MIYKTILLLLFLWLFFTVISNHFEIIFIEASDYNRPYVFGSYLISFVFYFFVIALVLEFSYFVLSLIGHLTSGSDLLRTNSTPFPKVFHAFSTEIVSVSLSVMLLTIVTIFPGNKFGGIIKFDLKDILLIPGAILQGYISEIDFKEEDVAGHKDLQYLTQSNFYNTTVREAKFTDKQNLLFTFMIRKRRVRILRPAQSYLRQALVNIDGKLLSEVKPPTKYSGNAESLIPNSLEAPEKLMFNPNLDSHKLSEKFLLSGQDVIAIYKQPGYPLDPRVVKFNKAGGMDQVFEKNISAIYQPGLRDILLFPLQQDSILLALDIEEPGSDKIQYAELKMVSKEGLINPNFTFKKKTFIHRFKVFTMSGGQVAIIEQTFNALINVYFYAANKQAMPDYERNVSASLKKLFEVNILDRSIEGQMLCAHMSGVILLNSDGIKVVTWKPFWQKK